MTDAGCADDDFDGDIDSPPTVFVNGIVHTGAEVLSDHAVVVRGATISDITRRVPPGARIIDLAGRLLAPGFVDLQVNGGGDVLFNDHPDLASVRTIARAHRRFGTTDLLPTFITGASGDMHRAAGAVAAARAVEPGVLGIHFEGPCIGPARLGVHDPAARRGPDDATTAALTALTGTESGAITVVTLAPEAVPAGYIAELVERGVHVSIGHTDAPADEVRAALAEGASLGTHVWNAMSPLTSRDPGAVGALLAAAAQKDLWCGVIADGHHVELGTLALSLRAAGGRAVLVSDAMSCVGGTATEFALGDLAITVRDGQCRTADGTLAGSCLDLATAVRNVVRGCGVEFDEALRMASTYPAAAVGLADRRGLIAPGRDAHLVVVDHDVEVSGVYYAGRYDGR